MSPLSLPESLPLALALLRQSEAVELLVRRATTAQPSFKLDAANAPVVAEICRHLDGLPLGIELAAARADVLSPDQVLAGLDDRFRLLRSANRSGAPVFRRPSVDLISRFVYTRIGIYR